MHIVCIYFDSIGLSSLIFDSISYISPLRTGLTRWIHIQSATTIGIAFLWNVSISLLLSDMFGGKVSSDSNFFLLKKCLNLWKDVFGSKETRPHICRWFHCIAHLCIFLVSHHNLLKMKSFKFKIYYSWIDIRYEYEKVLYNIQCSDLIRTDWMTWKKYASKFLAKFEISKKSIQLSDDSFRPINEDFIHEFV